MAIPTCKSFVTFRSAAGPSEVSLTIAGVEHFFRYSECLEESAINVLFWTYSQTFNGQDPVLALPTGGAELSY